MSDLVAFLNARLDEDEAAAKAAEGPWQWWFEPARMIREVEAKRRILARYEFARNQIAVGQVNEAAGYGPADSGWPLRADSHELDVRNLAAVYSGHPGYDPAWKCD